MVEKENKLSRYGFCSNCEQWVKLKFAPDYDSSIKNGWLEEHYLDGVKCENSGYSPLKYKYEAETIEAGIELAKRLASDKKKCLEGNNKDYHSLACGDGRNCEEERALLFQALARFVLKNEQILVDANKQNINI